MPYRFFNLSERRFGAHIDASGVVNDYVLGLRMNSSFAGVDLKLWAKAVYCAQIFCYMRLYSGN